MDRTIEVKATYDRDTRRFHRFIIDEKQDAQGMIYISKKGGTPPDHVIIEMNMPEAHKE